MCNCALYLATVAALTKQCQMLSLNRQCYQLLSEKSMLKYQCRKFSDKHEWVEVSGSSGKIGITNYAQDALGDIVYAQLPELDSEFSQGDECGALESVKAASELYCPVSGRVTEVNSAAEDQPSLINKSCYDEGMLYIHVLQLVI
ncbi:hypothetical protein HAZT_HAZT004785 [Hyalella azteca]|uniref:Glycine cleavage system H protein, mitochondrial n=1 Tax=Hyalella azteca TaxID=294128 RepID=A0A6A0H9V2_HYAAZ|nr:hypothetical protein HAZT_HAZT004785 [Hyalella azteca]